MAAGRRRRGRAAQEAESQDRWLLTYADMITLLLALFMVLFSISSVNVSKFDDVRGSLSSAFSGQILPGGESFRQTGGSPQPESPEAVPPIPELKTPAEGEGRDAAGRREQEDFEQLKQQIDQYTEDNGLDAQVSTEITRRGLVVRLLTDKILFGSGEAALKPPARPVLRKIAQLLKFEVRHPIFVEGHTDSVPIRSTVYPTNWELSTGRASSVVRELINRGVARSRLGAAGYASEHPIATNRTDRGRARNRRVEIVLTRQDQSADKTP